MLTKFPDLATSGRHNSAMITYCWKFFYQTDLLRDVWFLFLSLELIQSLSPGLYVPQKKGTYPNFRQRPMSDIAYQNQ